MNSDQIVKSLAQAIRERGLEIRNCCGCDIIIVCAPQERPICSVCELWEMAHSTSVCSEPSEKLSLQDTTQDLQRGS